MSETGEESHFSSPNVVETTSSHCFGLEYTYKKFTVWQSFAYCRYFAVETSKSKLVCSGLVYTVYPSVTQFLWSSCYFINKLSVSFLSYIKSPQGYYIYIYIVPVLVLSIFIFCRSDLLDWLFVCFGNIFGYMSSKATHCVEWNIWGSLNAGHFTPAFILHIPVSFFSSNRC